MGGLIAVGLIEEDGSFATVVGHTNTLFQTIKNERFALGDLSQLRAWLARYRDHDLPENMDDEDFGPGDHLPSEYGYVLVDAREKVVMSAQGYTSIMTLAGPQIASDEQARIVDMRITHDEEGEQVYTCVGPYSSLAEFNADLENDPRKGVPTLGELLKEIHAMVPDWRAGPEDGVAELVAAAAETLEDDEERQRLADRVIAAMKEDETGLRMFRFEIDLKQWTVYDGDRDPYDLDAVQAYLSERGHLSQDIEHRWRSISRGWACKREGGAAIS